MIAKKCMPLAFLACLTVSMTASVETPKENKFVKKTKEMYAQLVKYKKSAVQFVKNHPFITMTILMTIVSKKMQNTLISLPEKIWKVSQEHPIIMALNGGFLLSYVLV